MSNASNTDQQQGLGWDPNDPHGHHEGEHHGHKIVDDWMLKGVLGALLALTFLTVAASKAEVFIAEALDITIPQIVNVAIAMSIATVKGIIVALVFMQLIWDKKLHAFAMAVCLLCVGLFLGFTALDVTNRQKVFDWKQAEIVDGGTGVGDALERVRFNPDGTPVLDEDGNPVTGVIQGPIVQWAKDAGNARGALGDATAQKLADKHHSKTAPVTTSDQRVDMTGLRLFAGEAHGDHHGSDHGADHSGDDTGASTGATQTDGE